MLLGQKWTPVHHRKMSETEKLDRLRQWFPGLPNIYALSQYGFTPNGCGPQGDSLGTHLACALTPNTLLFMPWWDLWGDMHDFLFWIGGGEAEFHAANAVLRDGMRSMSTAVWYNPASWIEHARMMAISDAFFEAVDSLGRPYFNWDRQLEQARRAIAGWADGAPELALAPGRPAKK